MKRRQTMSMHIKMRKQGARNTNDPFSVSTRHSSVLKMLHWCDEWQVITLRGMGTTAINEASFVLNYIQSSVDIFSTVHFIQFVTSHQQSRGMRRIRDIPQHFIAILLHMNLLQTLAVNA